MVLGSFHHQDIPIPGVLGLISVKGLENVRSPLPVTRPQSTTNPASVRYRQTFSSLGGHKAVPTS